MSLKPFYFFLFFQLYKRFAGGLADDRRPGDAQSGTPALPSFFPPSLLLMCVVEQDGFDHAREDLGHVGAHDLRDHLREDDACLQRLGPHKQVVGELVELPHHLGEGGGGGKKRERTQRYK